MIPAIRLWAIFPSINGSGTRLWLQYLDNGSSRRAGLRVWDRPSDVSFPAIYAIHW